MILLSIGESLCRPRGRPLRHLLEACADFSAYGVNMRPYGSGIRRGVVLASSLTEFCQQKAELPAVIQMKLAQSPLAAP